MTVLDGVQSELSKLPANLQESGLAAIATAMAERIDQGRGSPSECGKVAIEALSKLRDLAPEEATDDGINDIERARAKRRARA